jgi:hypothetical protein
MILAGGFGAGALNGLIISQLKLQPFLVTLAGWSVFTGIALMILPTDGGSVPGLVDRISATPNCSGCRGRYGCCWRSSSSGTGSVRHASRHCHPGDGLERAVGGSVGRLHDARQRRCHNTASPGLFAAAMRRSI